MSVSRTIPSDPNAINLADYKGQIQKCQYCKPEETILGRACQWCMSNGYLAVCTNCNGTGKHSGKSVWDGGRSDYTATCTPCGGKGHYPARESEFIRQQAVMAAPVQLDTPLRSLPSAITPMRQLNVNRSAK